MHQARSSQLLTNHPTSFAGASGDAFLYQGVIVTDKSEYRDLLAEAEEFLTDSTNTAIRDRIKLRDAVCAYLAGERAKGTALTTVLLSVEEILKRAEARVVGNGGHRERAQQLIDWCVELNRPGKLRIV